MSTMTDYGTELPDKDDISAWLLTLDLGYTYQMSDYAGSTAQEKEFEREGLKAVDALANKIAEAIQDAYTQGTYDAS